MIRVKRVYDPCGVDDGPRFLVDRIWPRGFTKESLPLAGWLKELAPSSALRTWFSHDPEKWEEFCRRYHAELAAKSTDWLPLVEMARIRNVTLLYSAHDRERNNAVALRLFLEAQLLSG